ncbi:MAG TPA: T9SS type A sorting domain-containing protein [Flavobacterium sp.]|nr:T9SS type A sorting domain-containing protein [Flavobacterium sp.]
MKKIYTLIAIFAAMSAANAQVVISQVYGGGGNSGATYKSDFVELFNQGSSPVSITGYVLQYATAAGSFGGTQTKPNKVYLPNATIQPGGYFLIQLETGSGGTTDLDPDFTPTGNELINMSGINFKIALTSDDVTITSPTDTNVLDFVGVGNAILYEGTAATAPLSNITAALRNGAGCSDSDDNSADFTVGTPNPRNSQTAVNICATSVKQNNILELSLFPNPATEVLYITSNTDSQKDVQLFDMTGKKVLNVTTTSQINIAHLRAGIYIAKITENGKTATRKIIIK